MKERKGCDAMAGKVLISGGERLGIVSLRQEKLVKETPLEGCSAVCLSGKMVFAAGENDRAVYRLDENLLPCGVYAGGPGMGAVCISGDGQRLYVLLRDADSVMMLNASDGSPMFLARAGVSPMAMHLEENGRCLIVAGGKDGQAMLLCPHTLRSLHSVREEGICLDALLFGDTLCMMSMTEALHTQLTLRRMPGLRRTFLLPGMPGSLCAAGDELFVSTGDGLYVFDAGAMRLKRRMTSGGIYGKLLKADGRLLLISAVHEALFLADGCRMRLLCRNVRHASVSG